MSTDDRHLDPPDADDAHRVDERITDERSTDDRITDRLGVDSPATTPSVSTASTEHQEDTMSHTTGSPGTPGTGHRPGTSPDQTATLALGTSGWAGSRTEQRHEPRPWEVDDTAVPGPSTPTTGAAPAGASAAHAPAPVARGVRVGTVVWGLVVALVGVGLLALAAGLEFDVQLAFIALVALAGIGLLVGSLVTAGRRRART